MTFGDLGLLFLVIFFVAISVALETWLIRTAQHKAETWAEHHPCRDWRGHDRRIP